MKLRYTLYIMGVSFLLFGCAPYIGECRYPVVMLDETTSIEKRGFMGGRCKVAFSKVPTIYSVNNDKYNLKLILGERQYPLLFFSAMDQHGNILDMDSENTFFRSVTDYSKDEQSRIKKETGYLVSHVYAIQKELSSRQLSDSLLIKAQNISINILFDNKVLGEKLIEYKIDSFKHFAIETI